MPSGKDSKLIGGRDLRVVHRRKVRYVCYLTAPPPLLSSSEDPPERLSREAPEALPAHLLGISICTLTRAMC